MTVTYLIENRTGANEGLQLQYAQEIRRVLVNSFKNANRPLIIHDMASNSVIEQVMLDIEPETKKTGSMGFAKVKYLDLLRNTREAKDSAIAIADTALIDLTMLTPDMVYELMVAHNYDVKVYAFGIHDVEFCKTYNLNLHKLPDYLLNLCVRYEEIKTFDELGSTVLGLMEAHDNGYVGNCVTTFLGSRIIYHA